MNWFPIGPDFVFAPRNPNFKRISRRNEMARQCSVNAVAVDPTNSKILYVINMPNWGGTSAFRSIDAGASWVCIADGLHKGTGSEVDPNIDLSCIAINPQNTSTLYMGSFFDGGFFVSTDQGATWSRHSVGGRVRKLLVVPNAAATMNPTLYAATDSGVWRSPDGGTTWTNVLPGDIYSLVAAPNGNKSDFYAGINWGAQDAKGASLSGVDPNGGIYHTTNPVGSGNWAKLPVGAPGGSLVAPLVDYCPNKPTCLYALVFNATPAGSSNPFSATLYTTASPLTSWSRVSTPPLGSVNWLDIAFSVAPNSPGDGTKRDVLLFGSTNVLRSTDSGRTWAEVFGLHADIRAIAFAYTRTTPSAVDIPVTYVCNDGGLEASSRVADPAYDASTDPSTVTLAGYNEDVTYDTTSGAWQNLNHGRQSSMVHQYASDPSISALSYIGCTDTGLAGGTGALGWRSLGDADVVSVAAARGEMGVNVWYAMGYTFDQNLTSHLHYLLDKGDFSSQEQSVYLDTDLKKGYLTTTSNHIVGPDGSCLAGVVTYDSMAMTHSVFLARITGEVATRISQDFFFGAASDCVFCVAQSPVGPNSIYCATYPQTEASVGGMWSPSNSVVQPSPAAGHKLWWTQNGQTASASTNWTEITDGKPANITIASVCIDSVGNVFVLLDHPEVNSHSPLFKIVGNKWVMQPCTNLPTEAENDLMRYRKLVADPVLKGVLYASHGARVYRLAVVADADLSKSHHWAWSDISAGLPGQWVYDLWIGLISAGSSPKRLLRAAISTSGVWETDPSDPAPDYLYVRDNCLDQGWLAASPDGVPDPYDPWKSVWHWQCADIKVDVQQPSSGDSPPFFQTDPESNIPPSHVVFDQIQDGSRNLNPGANALVHVQVHSRSIKVANKVLVWALYCHAEPIPQLNASKSNGNAFNFWSLFNSDGTISNQKLPSDSPWKPIGKPQQLSGIDPLHPQIATWDWNIPALKQTERYCIAVFIHSPDYPLKQGPNSYDIDKITSLNRQIGQKYVYIVQPTMRVRPISPGPLPKWEVGGPTIDPQVKNEALGDYVFVVGSDGSSFTVNRGAILGGKWQPQPVTLPDPHTSSRTGRGLTTSAIRWAASTTPTAAELQRLQELAQAEVRAHEEIVAFLTAIGRK